MNASSCYSQVAVFDSVEYDISLHSDAEDGTSTKGFMDLPVIMEEDEKEGNGEEVERGKRENMKHCAVEYDFVADTETTPQRKTGTTSCFCYRLYVKILKYLTRTT